MKRLYYNEDVDRWCIGERELHCGDCFSIFADRIGLPPIEVRIEHSSHFQHGWYLISPYGNIMPSQREAR